MSVLKSLKENEDKAFKEFQSKLVPNIDPATIIGVRTPQMKQIAKQYSGTKEGEDFLKKLPHKYYEENMIHIFMVSMIKDFDKCTEEIERFLPYVDCWPVCDQSSPKVYKKNHEKLLPFIKKWIASEHVYTSRFGMRMLMNEFLDGDFKKEYLKLVADKKAEDYYLKMMQAWYFATALAKQYDEAVVYIEKRRLDPWVHTKAIQKAIESYRVTDEHKEYLRTLK